MDLATKLALKRNREVVQQVYACVQWLAGRERESLDANEAQALLGKFLCQVEDCVDNPHFGDAADTAGD